MADRAFPADFPEDTAPAAGTKLFGSDGYIRLDTLVGPNSFLGQSVAGGLLVNPTVISANGALPTDASFFLISAAYYAGLPAATQQRTIWIQVVTEAALIRDGYPGGTDLINGAASLSLHRPGLYVAYTLGAGAWGVFAASNEPKHDLTRTNGTPGVNDDETLGYGVGSFRWTSTNRLFICRVPTATSAVWDEFTLGVALQHSRDGSHAPPTSADDDTAGWAAGSEIVANNGSLYICLSAATGVAVWLRVPSAPVLEDAIADAQAAADAAQADVDAHEANTSNPHAVTAAQAGAVATTGHAALSVPVSQSGSIVDLASASNDTFLGRIGGAIAWTALTIGMIADGLLTRAKLANGTALSIIGRSANSSGAVADIAATASSDAVLRESGGTVGWGTIATAGIANGAVTGAKIQQSGTFDIGASDILTTGTITTSFLKSGSGSPEGAATAAVGAIYRDTTNGKLYQKRTGSGNTGWVLHDRCESGTYTPTGTTVTNLDSVTPSLSFYQRVGDIVTVALSGTMDPTASGNVVFGISLPIASNFAAATDATGTVGGLPVVGGNSMVAADATNDRLTVNIGNSQTASTSWSAVAQYRVL